MATININRKVSDYYYRYKMPKIQAKVEGRGNGIKTVFVNLIEVAKALKRPPLYPLKYIGCELGAQTIADIKNERFIVNGAHDADKLQNILDGFIEKYVLCIECKNPETQLSVYPRKEQIVMRCIACGCSGRIATTHRVTTYILKNPPILTKQDKKLNSVKTANNRSTTNDSSNNNGVNVAVGSSCMTDEKGDDIFDATNTQLEEQENGEEWNVDVSESAVRKRQQMLASHVRALTLDADSDKPIHEKLEILESFIKEKLTENPNLNNHFNDIIGEIKRLDIENKAIFAIASSIFNVDIVKQLTQHHLFLKQFCENQHRIQKYLIGSIERIIEQNPDQLLCKVPIIFKIMFEADIVDEDVFLDWDSKRTSRFVSKETFEKIKTASFRFIDWLKNAEEESSEEDDEEEEEEDNSNYNNQSNDIDNKRHSSSNSNNHHMPTEPIGNQDDDGPDINIDDI